MPYIPICISHIFNCIIIFVLLYILWYCFIVCYVYLYTRLFKCILLLLVLLLLLLLLLLFFVIIIIVIFNTTLPCSHVNIFTILSIIPCSYVTLQIWGWMLICITIFKVFKQTNKMYQQIWLIIHGCSCLFMFIHASLCNDVTWSKI